MNFNKKFFKENQKLLLKVANKWYLCWLLGLNRLPKDLKGKKILRITPNSIAYDYKDGKVTEAFFTRPRFAEALAFNLSPFAYLKNNRQTKWQWRFSPVGLASSIILALSGVPIIVGTTSDYYVGSGDGVVRSRGGSDWSAKRNASSGDQVDYTNSPYGGSGEPWASPGVGKDGNGNVEDFGRCFMPIDTSGIIDSAIISSANLYVYLYSKRESGITDGEICLIQTTQSSTSSLSLSDWSALTLNSPDEGANRKTIASFNTSSYSTISLNSTGIGWISKTGYTKLGLRHDYDIDDIEPSTNQFSNIKPYSSEQTGTSQDPYLSVTYTSTVDYTLTLNNGSFTLTGISATLKKALNLALSAGSYVLNLLNAKDFYFKNLSKNSTSLNNNSKNNISLTNQSKNSSSSTNLNK